MKQCAWLLTLILLGAAAPPLRPAQAAQEKPAGEAAGTVVDTRLPDRDYKLRPGDTVEISVDRHPEYTRSETLFADGTINDRIGQSVLASGLTTRDLAERLTEIYRKELKRPVIRVSLRERYVPPKVEKVVVHPKITVLGAVSRQGVMELQSPKWFRILLAEISPNERADLSRINIKYPDGKERIIDFSRFLVDGRSRDDLMILGGEEITIREREAVQRPDPIRLEILGDVNQPGPQIVEGKVSLLEAIQKAGAKSSAELTKVEITGPAHKEPKFVNVEAYMLGDVDEKYIVQQGDIVRIAQKELKVQVFGEVGRPGDIAIRRRETVASVYLQAGIDGEGDESRAELIRRGPDGKPIRRTINIRDIQKQRDPDVEMVAGDVLFIPHKKIKRGPLYYLGQIIAPLWMASSARSLGF